MKHIKISEHLVDSSKSYLFDTNVWMYIYGPASKTQPNQRRVYTNLLNEISFQHANVYITSLILSEYINRSLRIGFNEWKSSLKTLQTNAYGKFPLDFKRDYRPTADYDKTLQDIVVKVKYIMKLTVRHPDEFDTIDIDHLFGMMDHSCDYNDAYLVKCCESGSMILVSDDRDVKNIPGSVCLVSAR